MEPLMCLKGDDILAALLFEAAETEQGTSPTSAEEATHFGKDPSPTEAWEMTTCPPDHIEDELVASPNPTEEALLLSEHPEPQLAHTPVPYIPI